MTQAAIFLVSFQQLVAASRRMYPYVESSGVKIMLSSLKIITFDYEFIRPGLPFPFVQPSPLVGMVFFIFSKVHLSQDSCAFGVHP